MTEMNREIMYGLLREIKEVSMEASLTGSFSEGIGVMVEVYNRCLDTLARQGDALVKNLFPVLSANAHVDEVGVAAALLSRYIKPANGQPHNNAVIEEIEDIDEKDDLD